MSKDEKQTINMGEWLGLMDDEHRARVLEKQIAEEQLTARARITSEGETRRALLQTEGYHVVRGLWACVIALIVVASACTADRAYSARERIEAIRLEALRASSSASASSPR